MADTETTNYQFVKPEVGGSADTWGDKWNANADKIDAAIKANEDRIDALAQYAVPSGVIVMWSGPTNAIPAGWVLCNGSNGTPDLRNRFIVGAGSTYAVGATGGSTSHTHGHTFSVNNHTLNASQMPSHRHESGVMVNPSDDRIMRAYAAHGVSRQATTQTRRASGQEGDELYSFARTDAVGGSNAHSHGLSGGVSSASSLPPYYALAYIMKV